MLEAINTILSKLDIVKEDGFFLDNEDKALYSFKGRVVGVENYALIPKGMTVLNEDTKSVYEYFKDLHDRGVKKIESLPVLLTKPILSLEKIRKIVSKSLIEMQLAEPEAKTFFVEIIADKIISDYSICHRDNHNPDNSQDIFQQSEDEIMCFARERISCIFYEFTKTYYQEYHIQPKFDCSQLPLLIEFVAKHDSKAEIDTVENLIKNGLLQKPSRLLYRGGSYYEQNRAKTHKLGYPAFNIEYVNAGGTQYGKGLYTSKDVSVAEEYIPHNGGLMVEITTRQNGKNLQIEPSILTSNLYKNVGNYGISHPFVGCTFHNNDDRNIALIKKPELIEKIKVFDKTLTTKAALVFSATEITSNKFTQKTVSSIPSHKLTKPSNKLVIDHLKGQSSFADVYRYSQELNPDIASARNKNIETKYYIKNMSGQYIRVKPLFYENADNNRHYENQMFAITYAPPRQSECAASESIHTLFDNTEVYPALATNDTVPTPSTSTSRISAPRTATHTSLLQNAGEPSNSKSTSACHDTPANTNCDVCLCSCDRNDTANIKLPNETFRHPDCHTHATQALSKPTAEECIGGRMSWSIEDAPHLSHIAQEDRGQGVIVVEFNFEAPASFGGRPIVNRDKDFTHYMPNSLRGRQLLESLKTAFHKGKVVTLDNSHTTGQYGICFNLHLKTNDFQGGSHGYPCSTWDQALIESMLGVGVVVDLDSNPPLPEPGSVSKPVRSDSGQ
ncbi:hypothetical protein [Endozoicomonas ascidiicola]|uniref:hypothetical protein n=1 Tax=Endozoicomonas ascidiicola TaxID=1698521 RepID=UPI000835E12A|nr:hypothetical protein [Endozoicomonas ascidiicola]